jgi:hypothetical protein
MKTVTLLLAAVGFPAILAQSLTTSMATAVCEAHDDHWHCPSGVAEPTTLPALATASESDHDHDHEESHTISLTASGVCEAHGDHWHCPSGVPEPTTAPALSASESHDHEHEDEITVTATTCQAHGDHWHCPSGVAEPTTTPAATVTSAGTDVTSLSNGAPLAQSTNAAATGVKNGGVVAVVLGAVGAFIL